ncbi:MAG: TonB-dependent receptor plug domain-containing protein [Haliea sp.]
MNSITRKTLLAGAVTAISVCAQQSMAQPVLEEVIVTAQKRAQGLKDVPISISTFAGERLKNSGVENLAEVSASVPNFKVSANTIRDTISMRGVNSDLQSGGDQSVGIFVDGVFRGRGVQSRFAFVDMERLEVLRGPQGTLFGKNTAAGALNITSKAPTREFDAEISVLHELEYDGYEASGHAAGPLGENLRARMYLLARETNEGWVNNRYYDSDDPQNEEWAGRLSLDWDVAENVTAQFKYEHYDFDNQGGPFEIIATTAASARKTSGY